MTRQSCYQVIVKNQQGRLLRRWTAPLFGTIVVRHTPDRVEIEKRVLFIIPVKKHITGRNDSVEIRSWWWWLGG